MNRLDFMAVTSAWIDLGESFGAQAFNGGPALPCIDRCTPQDHPAASLLRGPSGLARDAPCTAENNSQTGKRQSIGLRLGNRGAGRAPDAGLSIQCVQLKVLCAMDCGAKRIDASQRWGLVRDEREVWRGVRAVCNQIPGRDVTVAVCEHGAAKTGAG